MSAFCALILFSVFSGLPVQPTTASTPAATLRHLPSLPGDKEQDREGDMILNRYFQASKKNILRGVIMVAHFAGRLPKMEKSATLDAKRHVSKEGVIEYDTTDRQGDVTIQKYLIATFINGEMENSGKDTSKVAVTAGQLQVQVQGQARKRRPDRLRLRDQPSKEPRGPLQRRDLARCRDRPDRSRGWPLREEPVSLPEEGLLRPRVHHPRWLCRAEADPNRYRNPLLGACRTRRSV